MRNNKLLQHSIGTFPNGARIPVKVRLIAQAPIEKASMKTYKHIQAADCYRMLIQLCVRTLYALVAFVKT